MLQSEPRPVRPMPMQAGLAERQNTFTVIDPDAVERPALESRVRSGFGTHFGACIAAFMPQLALYTHASGSTGIIGFRRASDEALFLENYLDRPIEAQIAAVTGRPVDRGRIAEVGQFVVDDRDIAGAFFRDLVPFLVSQRFDWVCFTGTDRIRAILARVGLRGLPVATANPASVQPTGDQWGRYYEHDPVVVVGRLDDPHGRWCETAAATPIREIAGV
jgi:hypothetical protein